MTARIRVSVAHSPDADDAFMFYGVACGAASDDGLEIVNEQTDIESLNLRAERGDLDVTAISFGAWPHFADHYDLLSVGSSFGLGYGPKLVSREPLAMGDVRSRVIAIPGEWTTAALALRMMLPGCATRCVQFDQIPAAIRDGAVDAGVVIHESQLSYAREGLHLVADLGEWWMGETGLPLPLGGNAVRRSLDADVTRRVASVLRRSIEHALAHRADALTHALRYGRGLDTEEGGRYVALYVNELTLDPGTQGRAAVAELYRRGARAGLIAEVSARWAP